MKNKTAYIFIALCFHMGFLAADEKRDKVMWKSAYDGKFSLTYKLAITKSDESINDAFLSQFVMAYVYYRLGYEDQMKAVLNGIDLYIENTLFLE